MSKLPRKLALITGGTGGVGFEVAKQILSAGQHDVLITSRTEEKGRAAVQSLTKVLQSTQQSVDFVTCQLDSFKSVLDCTSFIKQKHSHLDLLLCNAGHYPGRFERTADGYEMTMQTNHLSHFLMCNELLPLMSNTSHPSRIVLVSSELHKLIKPSIKLAPWLQLNGQVSQPFSSSQAYSISKLCNLWTAYHLARTAPHVIVNAVTPGYIPTTDMGRHNSFIVRLLVRNLMPWAPFAVKLEEGARRVTRVCVGEEEGRVSGKYFSKGTETESSALSYDLDKQEELWELSRKCVDILGDK